MSGRIHVIQVPPLPDDSRARLRRGQKDKQPEELDTLTTAYQYNLWAQSLLEPTFYHIRQMTKRAVDLKPSFDCWEGPSYKAHLEYAQARLRRWLTEHAGLPLHVVEDMVTEELIFMEGWSSTTRFWNHEGWNEKLYGPKPKTYAPFADAVAGAEQHDGEDHAATGCFQDMSSVDKDSEYPIALEKWKPSRPEEMREEYERAMKTKHLEWHFQRVAGVSVIFQASLGLA
ncbi:MAG: hypothetical protein Q9174_002787 [Haloplaca sp. 1 TL-2023]